MHQPFSLSGQGTPLPPSVVLPLALQTEALGLGWWSSSRLPAGGLLGFHPRRGQAAAQIRTGVKAERRGAWRAAAGAVVRGWR